MPREPPAHVEPPPGQPVSQMRKAHLLWVSHHLGLDLDARSSVANLRTAIRAHFEQNPELLDEPRHQNFFPHFDRARRQREDNEEQGTPVRQEPRNQPQQGDDQGEEDPPRQEENGVEEQEDQPRDRTHTPRPPPRNESVPSYRRASQQHVSV